MNIKTTCLSILCLGAAALPLGAEGTNQFASETARVSYALGMMTGHQWKQQDLGFEADVYAQGIKDALAGGQMRLTPEEATAAIEAFKKDFMASQQKKRAEQGAAFLAENKNKPGVNVLPDGLQYQILMSGTGPKPAAEDTVMVNYRGTFVDGTEFDSSYKRGQPWPCQVGGVIRGWTEALLMMNVGSKWKLVIPAELAYGENPPPRSNIPPNAVLVFEVELISIKAATPPPAPAAPPAPAVPAAPLTSDIIKVPSAEEMKKGAKIEVIKAEDVLKAQAASTNN